MLQQEIQEKEALFSSRKLFVEWCAQSNEKGSIRPKLYKKHRQHNTLRYTTFVLLHNLH